MIEFITKKVYAQQPVTTGAAIVTGSDPELTNILLQQLAIAIYAFQTNLETSTPPPGTSAQQRKAAPPAQPKPQSHESWVTALRVEGSVDAAQWQRVGEFPTGLTAASQVVPLPLLVGGKRNGTLSASSSAATLHGAKYKYLRLTPLKWNGEGRFGPAMRVTVLCPETFSDDEAAQQGTDAEVAVACPLSAGTLVEVVETLQGTLAVLVEAVEFVAKREEAAKELKQLEVKRVSWCKRVSSLPCVALPSAHNCTEF
jgi:hypothetical protein